MTEEDPWETPVEVELPYSTWLTIVGMTGNAIIFWEDEEDTEVPEGYEEARHDFMMGLERPDGVESPLKNNPELRKSFRKFMAGRIPEFQEEIDDDTVYCNKCEYELDYTPSVLSVHNLRRHEYHDDLYDIQDRECRECSSSGQFSPTTGDSGTDNLIVCEACGELQ